VKYNIEHRLTKPYHPQSNRMVERMNRKIGENVLQDKYKYWYNYIHLKHSGLNYKTLIEKVKKYYKKTEIFTKKIEDLTSEQKDILYDHRVELDNLRTDVTHISTFAIHYMQFC